MTIDTGGSPASVETLAASTLDGGRVPWWRTAVLYENHLPSLRDGNGDGIGDLEGLIESLDYLAGTLGVNAVWVGPFFRSPLLDQGFDISDYTDVEPVFGDLSTFDRLVEAAHARNLKVIVDYVPNHTSDQHPWFLRSRSSRASEYRDRYVWADPSADGGPPNNWTSEAGGSVWELDETTGQFYLHSHLKEQPDLNWRHPEVRRALLDVLRFWLDRGADGFRIDVAHMLMKDPELRDNPPAPPGSENAYDLQHPDFAGQLHVNDRMHPDLHGVLRDIRSVLEEYDGDRVAIGEISAMEWGPWAEFFGSELDELHLPFAFQLIETPWSPRELALVIEELDAALPSGAWPILALGNHDRSRLATRLGSRQARVAGMLLLTLRGTPTILYGDELGMEDQAVPRELQRDYFGLSDGGVSRDPTRTPMPWSSSPHGGFAAAEVERLWLPVHPDYERFNVQAQLAQDSSSLNLFRCLISLRGASPALREGTFALHHATDEHCLLYRRSYGEEHMLVVLNLTSAPREVRIEHGGEIVLSTTRGREGEACAGSLALSGDEGLIVRLASTGPERGTAGRGDER